MLSRCGPQPHLDPALALYLLTLCSRHSQNAPVFSAIHTWAADPAPSFIKNTKPQDDLRLAPSPSYPRTCLPARMSWVVARGGLESPPSRVLASEDQGRVQSVFSGFKFTDFKLKGGFRRLQNISRARTHAGDVGAAVCGHIRFSQEHTCSHLLTSTASWPPRCFPFRPPEGARGLGGTAPRTRCKFDSCTRREHKTHHISMFPVLLVDFNFSRPLL